MNCVNHADVEANAFCNQCGNALCEPCVRQIRNSVYCESCLAESIGGGKKASAKSAQRTGGTSPEAAFVLGLIPGVGAIYNAEFFKAALHVFIWATLITMTDAVRVGGVLFTLAAVGFYFYMPFEAYYTAKKRKLAREGIDLETPFDRLNEQLNEFENKELWGGVTLIVLGTIFLLDNFDVIRLYRLAQLWPLMLIAAGIYLLRRFQAKAT